MGIKGWYLYGSEKSESSYTEFNTTGNNMPESSYTDFTVFDDEEQFEIAPARGPVRTRPVQAPEVRAARPAKAPKARATRPVKVKAKKVKAAKPAKAEKIKPAKAVKVKPIKKRSVRQPEADFEAVEIKPAKKHSKGKAVLCVFGVLVLVGASVIGAGCYFGEIDINDFLSTGSLIVADKKDADEESTEAKGDALSQLGQISEKASKNMVKAVAMDTSHPAYGVAEKILSNLQCDNDIDTAYAIFDWVHSNILYQTIFEEQSYEDAAYRGFTRRNGDCYVYFSCAKMLLDLAGIPNLMVTRYPVVTNGHYWNLVQLNGEWWHCDATVFRDRYEMYFMATDDDIDDGHHDFDHSLYPERAKGFSGWDDWNDDWSDDDWNDDWNDEWNDDWNDNEWNGAWGDDDWNNFPEEDPYNIDVQYDNPNDGYAGEIDDNIEVWADDFEDEWN